MMTAIFSIKLLNGTPQPEPLAMYKKEISHPGHVYAENNHTLDLLRNLAPLDHGQWISIDAYDNETGQHIMGSSCQVHRPEGSI